MEEKTIIECPICFTECARNANYCPACGEPISELAKDFESEKKTNIEIAILMKVMDYMKDEKDVKFLKGLIDKLAE